MTPQPPTSTPTWQSAPIPSLLPNTMLTGQTAIGEECEIGPNSVVRDTVVGDRCRVVASVLEGARVMSDVDIGPYSHLRPAAVIESGVHLGNYVEVKNSRVGADTAAGHFCYLGDADIGAGVNIGAGAITCNYDGVDKHRTVIGAGRVYRQRYHAGRAGNRGRGRRHRRGERW